MNALAPRPPAPPLGMLCELTHRCPLQCPYCSNPVALERSHGELSTEEWLHVLSQARAMGVIHLHLSGGEPTVRRDLEVLIHHAASIGLYTNLITAGVLLDRARLERLVQAGLDHVQLSLQAAEPGLADRIAGYPGGHARKLAFAEMVTALDLPLTINAVMHRQNLDQLPAMIDLAVGLGARRLEVASVQYYGWAIANRGALMPGSDQLEALSGTVAAARERLKGVLTIDFVVPDYYARRPKPCMGGWARQFLNVTPTGKVLPCHAAETIPGLVFDTVRERPLAEIWHHSAAFNRFRGTAWMPEPCQSCDLREVDWGGCRCQALAVAGDAALTDPACELSPHHDRLRSLAEADSAAGLSEFNYRRFRKPAAADVV
ncbi:MAG: pyrroloquinoline quinone biosynthesis protein PqqE [Azospirillum sp.]|nr:pyrroloquinoline quinone biosynthesis protein PqqE [Azospirillum sp.]